MAEVGWEIVVLDNQPKHVWRSASAEARQLARWVPVEVAARWRMVRLEMTTGLRKRVRQDVN